MAAALPGPRRGHTAERRRAAVEIHLGLARDAPLGLHRVRRERRAVRREHLVHHRQPHLRVRVRTAAVARQDVALGGEDGLHVPLDRLGRKGERRVPFAIAFGRERRCALPARRRQDRGGERRERLCVNRHRALRHIAPSWLGRVWRGGQVVDRHLGIRARAHSRLAHERLQERGHVELGRGRRRLVRERRRQGRVDAGGRNRRLRVPRLRCR
mmetsp:Transcript_21576/g.66929  ORF Transcript_21576/g.66929 Transcript_21576/m.66929 type:complete len:213 (-) Transcript_21576:291-929(-)